MKQLFLLSLILISGFSSSMAQTCLSGNCSNGFGKFQYANGDVYEGEFYDDKREGFGIYKWKGGEKFIGESLANQFNGFGVMEFRDGTRYIGDFKNGEFEGEGEKTLTNGNKQTGLFAKGVYKGKISYYNKPLGTTGCLNGDCENGYGMKYYSGDDRYFGYFKNGKRHGFGAYYWSDGTKWVGQFDDNKLTGYGTYFFITGEKYVGYFVDSKRNGWGINYDPTTGVKKIGFWADNNLTQPKNGLVSGGTTGCISGDCKNGYGKYVYSNGFYEGYFKNGFRNGNGKYYFDIGDFYVGNFSDNKFNGKGTYYYTNGQRYDGEWKEQRYHGKGQLFNTDGMPENGYYEAGKYLGETTRPAGYDAWVRNNYNAATNNSVATNNNPPNNNSNSNNSNVLSSNSGNNNKPNVNTKPNNNTNPTNTNTGNNNNQVSYSGGSNAGLNTTNYSKKLALIIGMERYQFITALRNPRNDARSMSKVLRDNGFEVIEVIDGSKEQLKNAIKEFGYKLASYQVGLFYYSGHGIQIDDQNYIIPVDANIRSKTDVKDECPSVSWVLRRMEDANTKLNIVILDACRNNPFQRSAFGSENSEGGLAAILPPDNTIISFATDPGSVASDGVAGTNGLYTGSLVKYISMPNMQIENVFKLTGKEVKEKSGGKQKPWLNSNFYDIFYFK